jgi:hypothetical protein
MAKKLKKKAKQRGKRETQGCAGRGKGDAGSHRSKEIVYA